MSEYDIKRYQNQINSTYREIEAMAESAERETAKRMAVFERALTDKLKSIEKRVCNDLLRERFISGAKIEGYTWSYQRVFTLHSCFVTGRYIYPGEKAYCAEILTSKEKECGPNELEITLYPRTIWLTKEEFTTRRLKGQI